MMRAAGCLALLVVMGAAAGAQPCGTRSTPPAAYEHVVWIWFENKSFGDIIGSGAARYMNQVARSCGLATNYDAITHPSLPNYIAATSGLPPNALGPWHNDCNATRACRTNAASIFAQAPSWAAYAEGIPRPCARFFHWPYTASHNPAVYYRSLADCSQRNVGLRGLKRDLDADVLPAFVFITPDMCHSMHNCAVGTGDVWLRHVLTRLTSSAAYQRGATAIFVAFDESADHSSDNRVVMLVVSPSTPAGERSGEHFTHYSLLRTTEEMLGLDAFLGQAARARSMRAAFNL